MSHCAPEATLNPIRLLKITPETVVSNVFVAQVCWEAVPDTWPGNSKAPVAKCVVRAWNGARSVGGRAEPASRTFRDQVYVVGQVRRCLAGQRQEDKACQFEVDTSLDREPVQLTQNWRDMFPSSSSSQKSSGRILDAEEKWKMIE